MTVLVPTSLDDALARLAERPHASTCSPAAPT